MKALKTIGIVVGVVALAATGVGLALGGATAAAATAAAGSSLALGSTLMTVGAIASVAAGLISVGTSLFARKPGFSSEGNPLQFQTNPQSGLPYAIGRTRMSGLRIHADTYDAPAYKSEGKQDALAFAVLLSAGGEIEEIESFRADKEVIAFDGSTGMATGSYANWMAQKVSLGLAGASALALAFGGGSFPGWTADHKLSGMTHALWVLRGDEKGAHFGAGVSEPEWIGKWVKVYDPRKDSTYPGGAGSHRSDDEATFEWSDNPYLHSLTWCLGRWQNDKKVLGIGAPIENIRVADFVEGANVAEANDWTCGGVEWSTDPKWTILKKMLQAGGGEPTMAGAMIGCRVNTPRVSVATVTADKLLDRLSMATTRSRRDRFNTVIPRYRSEDHDWQVISGSPVSVSAYVTADGGQRTKEIDFPLVQHEVAHDGNAQAGQLAAYEIVNSREGGPIRFTVGPEYVGVKSGDVITLDVPDEGLDAQPVLIRSRSIDPASFRITYEAETETEAKHAFALGKTTTPPPTYSPTPPDLTPPAPSAALWSLTAELAGGVVPAIRIAGACEFPGADTVIIEYRKDGDADWLSGGTFEASSPVDVLISTVQPGSAYEARLRYKSGNRVGDWRQLADVTTGDLDIDATIQRQLLPGTIALSADRTGAVADYSAAETTFVLRLQDGTDISTGFTFATATGGNPASLTVGYVDNVATITGGFDEEVTASLAIEATGTGVYTGIVLTETLNLVKNTIISPVDAALEPPNARVPTDASGDPVTYAPAVFDFVIRAEDGSDISASFTYAVTSNPATLAFTKTANNVQITGGFTEAESPAFFTVEATGTGDYAGIVYSRTFLLETDQTGVMLQQLQDMNDFNGTAITAAPTGISDVTLATTHPDGRVTYTARLSFTYSTSPGAADNFDDIFLAWVQRPTNAAVTLAGPGGSNTDERGGRMLVDVTKGYVDFQLLSQVDPTQYYTLGYAKFRKVDKSVDSKGYILGPFVQYGPFRPNSAQSITAAISGSATINGQSASTVATGGVRANTAIDGSGNLTSGVGVSATAGFAPVVFGPGLVLPIRRNPNLTTMDRLESTDIKVQMSRLKGGTDVTSSATWSVDSTWNCSASVNSSGLATVTGSTLGSASGEVGNAYARFKSTYESVDRYYLVGFENEFAPYDIPATYGFNEVAMQGYANFNYSAGYLHFGSTLAMIPDATGTLIASGILEYSAQNGTFSPLLALRRRPTSGGSWTDVDTLSATPVDFDSVYPRKLLAFLTSGFDTSLTNGTSYDYQLAARRDTAYSATQGDLYGRKLAGLVL